MAEKKNTDGATWVLRAGAGVAVVAALQACNEATRPAYQNYSSAARTAALAVVLVVVAFAVKAWQAMDRSGSGSED